MSTLLTVVIATLLAFTVIGLLCAVRIGLRRSPGQADPFSQPFGDVPAPPFCLNLDPPWHYGEGQRSAPYQLPGFTAAELRANESQQYRRDQARRAFVITDHPSDGVALRSVADGGFTLLSGFSAVRSFIRRSLHAVS